MAVIYKIRNVVNGKFYVGSTVKHKTRFQTHRRELRTGKHHCSPLQRAWDKYGEDCFKFQVVEEIPEGERHLVAEGKWLAEHFGKPYCYNTGREPNAAFLGRKHTRKAKAKVAAAQRGKRHRLGHTNSPEHRARQSASMRGIPKSPEHIEKIRQRMIGTSYAKGRIVTPEQRALFHKAIIETTTGLEFESVKAAAAHFEMDRPNLSRTLANGGLVKRGVNAGLRFQYKDALPA